MPWLPKPETLAGILPVIAQVTSVEVALRVAERYGNQGRRYIPAPGRLRRDHWLAQAIGHKAALLVAGRLKADHYDIPEERATRNKIEAVRLREQGRNAAEIARAMRISLRQVRRLIEGVVPGEAVPESGAAPETRCPVCGHRHGRPRDRGDDRQLALPITDAVRG